jgi:hypothetical protein
MGGKKKIPSFHTLNEEFLYFMKTFIWSNSVAYNCCSVSNFPLRRNLGHGDAIAAVQGRDCGPHGQQDHQGHARGQQRQPQHIRQHQRPAPRPPPPPQMNDSLRKVHELDPDGILDHNTKEDNTTNDGSNFKKDGEATDPCHTLSSSDSEEEGSCNDTEKEMDVDQPATATPSTAILAHTHDSGSGTDYNPGSTGPNTGPTPTAPAATGGNIFSSNIISGNKESAQLQPPVNAGTGPGSGPSSGLTVNQERGETFNNPEWKAKLEKLIKQKKFKIPDPPKTSAEKIPSGVKEPSTMKTTDSIPAEADAVPSKLTIQFFPVRN